MKHLVYGVQRHSYDVNGWNGESTIMWLCIWHLSVQNCEHLSDLVLVLKHKVLVLQDQFPSPCSQTSSPCPRITIPWPSPCPQAQIPCPQGPIYKSLFSDFKSFSSDHNSLSSSPKSLSSNLDSLTSSLHCKRMMVYMPLMILVSVQKCEYLPAADEVQESVPGAHQHSYRGAVWDGKLTHCSSPPRCC